MGMTQRFWPLGPILLKLMPKETQEAEAQLRAFTREQVDMCLEEKSDKKHMYVLFAF